MSKKKKAENIVDFSKLSPEVNIEKTRFSELYEKAFLKPSEKSDNEFCRNTTTWD